MWSKAHVRGILRDAEGQKTEVLQGVSGSRIFPEGGGCYTLPNQARYQTSLNPEMIQLYESRWKNGGCGRGSDGIITDVRGKSNGFFLLGRILFSCLGGFFFCLRGFFWAALPLSGSQGSSPMSVNAGIGEVCRMYGVCFVYAYTRSASPFCFRLPAAHIYGFCFASFFLRCCLRTTT